MADTARIERIRIEATTAKERADQLFARVSDPKFKQFIGMTIRRLGDIESFFLNHVDDVLPMNEDLWLQGAEFFLAQYIDELHRWEELVAERGDNLKMI